MQQVDVFRDTRLSHHWNEDALNDAEYCLYQIRRFKTNMLAHFKDELEKLNSDIEGNSGSLESEVPKIGTQLDIEILEEVIDEMTHDSVKSITNSAQCN